MTDTVFPPGFFDRADPGADTAFYAVPRLVTHIDERAVAERAGRRSGRGLDKALRLAGGERPRQSPRAAR